ncbi:MAG TPA: alpha/beta fold hydrolase [Kofleriaceae bacterium]|jgi:pimeloyl-ACP methyl ester carboxylesterase|nr:alpha/beta fold hydrolase [Kofleriaceae bacterium]
MPIEAPVAASPVTHGHLPVHGLQMYYEIHGAGAGAPLVLLHGGGSTIDSSYGRILPWLARHRQVIAIEEQAHGRTSDRDAPERFESSADDVAALLAQLGVARADVMGFSNGASVALQVAIRHPAQVRRLVFASSMTRRSGTHPAFWDSIAHASFADMPQSLKDAFLRVNPDPQKLRTMYERDIERMRSFRDVPDADVAAVAVPVLILAGDRDVPTAEHAVELSRLLPHARLAILPGGHGDYLGELLAAPREARYAELTAWLIDQFLDGAST